MHKHAEVGEVSVTSGYKIEWKIQNIFSYTKHKASYISPSFDVSGSSWTLYIHPQFFGSIIVHLSKNDSSPPQGANFNFGVKRADGTIEVAMADFTWVFDDKYEYLLHKLLPISELERRKSELALSDALTVTCSLRVYGSTNSSAGMDTLSHDLLDMFTSKRGCDVTLKVKDEEIPAHKFVLAARSPVFAAMFAADMKEKQTGVVDIADCDPGAFKEFLVYLYSGKAENLLSNAFELYRIADKYGVRGPKPDCLVYIMLNLTVESVLDAALLADQFSDTALKAKSNRFFNENFCQIVDTARWESFLKSDLRIANGLLKNMGSEMKKKKISL